MAWVYLVIAGLLEIVWAIGMKQSQLSEIERGVPTLSVPDMTRQITVEELEGYESAVEADAKEDGVASDFA